MKRGQIAEGKVISLDFPNRGIVHTDEGERVIVKNTLPGQRVFFQINKARKGKAEARLLEVLERSPMEVESPCPHAGLCGGCTYQTLPYEEQLALKEAQVRKLLAGVLPDMSQGNQLKNGSGMQESLQSDQKGIEDGNAQEPIDNNQAEMVNCTRELGDLETENESVCEFMGILPSPRIYGYRNKMEFSFGDEYKDGPLALGMHKRGSFYDIVTVRDCQIADADFRQILTATLDYFSSRGISFFHRMSHIGYLRHLLVRKAARTREILVDLVTTTQEMQTFPLGAMGEVPEKQPKAVEVLKEQLKAVEVLKEQPKAVEVPKAVGTPGAVKQPGTVDAPVAEKWQKVVDDKINVPGEQSEVSATEKDEKETGLLAGWRDQLLALPLEGKIRGILHTRNDSVADIIRNDGTDIFYGEDYFYEEILGLKFRITPFSFFQTNSLGAEVLYNVAREFILDGDENALRNKTVYDLYSGTGTIAQVIAPVCRKVVGVEIVEEAVVAARENAKLNGLSNCKFLAGDVLKVLDTIEEKPDIIILDPPRDGIHPKALGKIIAYGVERIVYISCKPTSLVRDLEVFQAKGYRAEKMKCVDMFPGTSQVETCILLTKSSEA